MLRTRNGRPASAHQSRANVPRRNTTIRGRKGRVFLAYCFADQVVADGLIALLQKSGFEVSSGVDTPGSASAGILQRIRECDFVLCVLTREDAKTDGTFTASTWLYEEKGAAAAFGKPIVLMVQEGIRETAGL